MHSELQHARVSPFQGRIGVRCDEQAYPLPRRREERLGEPVLPCRAHTTRQRHTEHLPDVRRIDVLFQVHICLYRVAVVLPGLKLEQEHACERHHGKAINELDVVLGHGGDGHDTREENVHLAAPVQREAVPEDAIGRARRLGCNGVEARVRVDEQSFKALLRGSRGQNDEIYVLY